MRIIEETATPERKTGRAAYVLPWATPGRPGQLKSPTT